MSTNVKNSGYGSVQNQPSHLLGEKKPFFLFDPERGYLRCIVLFFACFLTFGSYYCYDNPGALEDQIKHNFNNITTTRYQALYSVYSWPNTVLVFFGGWLIDRFFGLPVGAFIFCCLVLLGQVIFAIGVTVANEPGYYIALLGRFVFGLGGETLSVAQASYTAKWFRGKELALAFGITLSFSRIGSSINFDIEPTLVKHTSLPIGIWFGVIICCVSATSAVVLGILNWRGDRAVEENPELKRQRDIASQSEEKVSLLDVRFFPLSLWIIFAICVTFYVSVFVWIQIAARYISDYWNISDTKATFYVSLPYLVSAGVSPVVGFTVDRIGGAPFWISGATLVMTACHLSLVLFPFTHLTPFPAMIVQGIAYSTLAAALWPSVPVLVDQRITGTAFGLMTALQNTGLAVAPLVVGHIITKEGKKAGVYVLAGCAAASFLLSILLIFADLATGAKLIRKKKVGEQAIEDPAAQKPILKAETDN